MENKTLLKEVPNAINGEPLLNAGETSISVKASGLLRKMFYSACLAGIGISFNGCMAGYVASEPVYVEYDRPQRPGDLYVWIEDDWDWNSRSHSYVRKAGYWQQPRQGRTFESGHWQSTPKGKSWNKGHWQKQGNKSNRHGR
jgi:hypothetical protein